MSDLPPEFAKGFLYVEARERGISRARLSRRDLATPFRGVRVLGPAPVDHLSLCEAYALRMPPAHVFSHVTAAILHGIPLPFRLEFDVRLHVTVPAGVRGPQVRGVIGHQLRSDLMDVEMLGILPVTSPLQTWIDLGPMLSRGELVAAADYLCAGKEPRYTPRHLISAASQLKGRRGSRALREAAALARARVDSPKETETRLLLVDAGLPEPITNFEVAPDLHVDLAWPWLKVCVEYEGEKHRTDKKRFRSDITRRERLEDLHWRVIRVTEDDLREGGHEFLQRVRRALIERGWRR
jgi:hypothetical protein